MKTRVLLVDDHPMLRQGLIQEMKRLSDMEIVGEASDSRSAMELALKMHPDLVLMDIHLPDANGIEVSRSILDAAPSTRIIIYSGDVNRAWVDQALQAGICGYLPKDCGSEELIRAVNTVMEGRLYLSPDLASAVFKDYRNILIATQDSKPVLTERETQILRLVAKGFYSKEIADKLNVSIKSVEKSRSRVMDKLGCRGIAELTSYALREGIVSD
jgi:DNA-binding NarL/FixJ family response regulator